MTAAAAAATRAAAAAATPDPLHKSPWQRQAGKKTKTFGNYSAQDSDWPFRERLQGTDSWLTVLWTANPCPRHCKCFRLFRSISVTREVYQILLDFLCYRPDHYEWQSNRTCSLFLLLRSSMVELPFIVSRSVVRVNISAQKVLPTTNWKEKIITN